MLGNINNGGSTSLSRRTVLKCLGGLGAAATASSMSSGTATAAIGDSAVYQYYHTDWNTIKNNLSAVADAGYDAIQVPPAQFSRLYEYERQANSETYDQPLGYQPIDFTNFDSVFGTEAEYGAMVEEAHNQGLEVIADAVMNHMAAGGDYFDRQVSLDDLPMFSSQDFHESCSIDYNDPDSVESCWLVGLRDLKQESEYVRGQLYNYVQKYANLGVDGVRWDAAKHIPEWFFSDYANQWADEFGLYKVGEVLDGSLSVNQGYADTGMSVTDYALYFTMKDAVFNSYGSMYELEGAGMVNQDPTRAMTFVSNHDQGPPEYERLAYAFILTYEGYPRVYNHRIGIDDEEIKTLLWVRRNLLGGSATQRYVDNDLYAFERGDALVAINIGSEKTEWVETGFGANTTLSDCTETAGNVQTNGDAWVEISVPAQDYVIYSTACHDGGGGGGSGIQDGATYAIRNINSGKALDVAGGEGATQDGANVHQWEYFGSENQHWTVESVGDGYYRLTPTHSGKSLDVAGFSTDDGGNIHQWEYFGSENQQWLIEDTGNGYRIGARNSGKYLDVSGYSTDDGANVHQWAWHGGDNQRWTFEEV